MASQKEQPGTSTAEGQGRFTQAEIRHAQEILEEARMDIERAKESGKGSDAKKLVSPINIDSGQDIIPQGLGAASKSVRQSLQSDTFTLPDNRKTFKQLIHDIFVTGKPVDKNNTRLVKYTMDSAIEQENPEQKE